MQKHKIQQNMIVLHDWASRCVPIPLKRQTERESKRDWKGGRNEKRAVLYSVLYGSESMINSNYRSDPSETHGSNICLPRAILLLHETPANSSTDPQLCAYGVRTPAN